MEIEPDERIVEIAPERLRDFKDQPFKIRKDAQMDNLIDSISRYGILNPLIVRPLPEGVYEIISGHRRKYAAVKLGYRKLPVIIRNLKDEDAISEPLACLLSAAMKLPVQTLGDTAAVVGCGYMGLGTISLFKAMGYGNIIAIDKRPEALENAKKFGATETYLPEEIPTHYISDFETVGFVDLTRNGDNSALFALGIPTVMEFTGTEDGLQLAGRLVKAHGRLGIGGYHNDGMRSIDYKLWNFKAITTINCHERRIDYEADLCRRCMELLEKGIWKFTGVTKVYDMKDFDEVSEMMINHTDGFIKAAFRC